MTVRFSLADPEWYPHRYVESEDRFRFIRLLPETRRRVTFLTDEELGAAGETHDVSTAECLAQGAPGAPRLLFHTAFCGSTLLVHALDQTGIASGLSEPVALNDIVGFRRRGGEPRNVARAMDCALRLLGRTAPGEAGVVIKPSNIVNPLAEMMLAMQPAAGAVVLYAPLESFLISVVRKGLWCRLWVRELFGGLLRDGVVRLGLSAEEVFRLTDLQVAAAGWLVQQDMITRWLAGKQGGRLRTLSADTLMTEPARVLEACGRHFALPLDAVAAERIAQGPLFARHSKSGAVFDPAQREREYESARLAHGDEIEKVVAWAEATAGALGIGLTPAQPLLAR